jgi:hypothetical protein
MPVTVIDRIVPKNAGAFPVVGDEHFLGGFRVVENATARDAITSQRRTLGMWVKTRSDGKIWTLVGGLANSNWQEVSFGGGSGGGVTRYSTEVALKAATPTTGTIGFAEDTERFWFFTSFGWKPTPNEFAATIRPQPFDFVVDPVNGDDSPGNDGLLAPLKTLDELIKRLPARTTSRNWGEVSIGEQPTRVSLKAGTHALPSNDGMTEDFHLLINGLPDLEFYGEWSAALESFDVDSYSASGMKIHKPAGDPAWTTDALVGKWVKLSIDYGPPYGLFPFYFPIIANDERSITVEWAPDSGAGGVGWFTAPATGTEIEIVEIATTLAGPRLLQPRGACLTFSTVKLDGAQFPWGFAYCERSRLAFYNCHVFGNCGWYPPTGKMMFLLREFCFLSFGDCLIEDNYGMIYTQYPTSEVYFGSNAVLNSLRLVEGYQGRVTLWGSMLALRNAGDLFFMSRSMIGVMWHDQIYFLNPMGGGWTGALWELSNPNVDLEFRSNCHVVDGKSPGTWISCFGYGNRIRIASGFSDECSTPENSFLGPGGFTSSIEDLKDVYGGAIDFGRGGSLEFFG